MRHATPLSARPAHILCSFLLAAALPGAAAVGQQAVPFGPTPYLSFADSPFRTLGLPYLHVEDAEDGLINTPGLAVLSSSGSPVSIVGPVPGGIIDSVDGDDGAIDGCGTLGHSIFSCPAFIDIRFNAAALGGQLPTHAGVVWTDGGGAVRAAAFAADGASLGVITGGSSDGNFGCGTAEDRFYGFAFSGGIARLTIADENNCIEVDHIQYGGSGTGGVPCPVDFDRDGEVNANDISAYINGWYGDIVGGTVAADFDLSGETDANDISAYINAWYAAVANGGHCA